ncbi:MAG: universal stress protein [Candidatus Mariimomonas ferrooxydans]
MEGKGIKSRIVIEVGKPISKILDIAEEKKVDLIIVGRKKKIAIKKSFIGSYTSKIISCSHIPVLANKYMVQFELDGATLTRTNDRLFEMPLLITDWSDPSQNALEFLVSLKGVVKKVFVLHNIDVKVSKEPDKSELHHVEKECSENLDESCKKLKHAGIKAEPHLSAGDVVQEILRFSRERDATMIIAGTTCKDRLHEMLHRSISHQVAKMSELPTLLVP